MQYLDESGNVLYEVNDSDKIFKMVNGKISGLAGTGNRMVVADSSGNLSASSIFLRGGVTVASGGTVTVTLPDSIPTSDYAIFTTIDRGDYNGNVICTIRDRLTNEFKIHYYADDGVTAGVHWLLVY